MTKRKNLHSNPRKTHYTEENDGDGYKFLSENSGGQRVRSRTRKHSEKQHIRSAVYAPSDSTDQMQGNRQHQLASSAQPGSESSRHSWAVSYKMSTHSPYDKATLQVSTTKK